MGGQHSEKVAVKKVAGAARAPEQKKGKVSKPVPVVILAPKPLVALVEAPVMQALRRKLKFKRWV